MVIEQGGVQFVLVITRFRVQFEIHLPEKFHFLKNSQAQINSKLNINMKNKKKICVEEVPEDLS